MYTRPHRAAQGLGALRIAQRRAAPCQSEPRPAATAREWARGRWGLLLWAALTAGLASGALAQAQGQPAAQAAAPTAVVNAAPTSQDVSAFAWERVDGALLLTFAIKPNLGKAVEDALRRGVPVNFVAEAKVFRSRWYWRDERMGEARRTWRLSYQPLTSNWRVAVGALSQSFDTFEEALAVATRASRWRVAEIDALEPGQRYYLEFTFKLDESQLPRPMQLDLGLQDDWRLSVERTVRLE